MVAFKKCGVPVHSWLTKSSLLFHFWWLTLGSSIRDTDPTCLWWCYRFHKTALYAVPINVWMYEVPVVHSPKSTLLASNRESGGCSPEVMQEFHFKCFKYPCNIEVDIQQSVCCLECSCSWVQAVSHALSLDILSHLPSFLLFPHFSLTAVGHHLGLLNTLKNN